MAFSLPSQFILNLRLLWTLRRGAGGGGAWCRWSRCQPAGAAAPCPGSAGAQSDGYLWNRCPLSSPILRPTASFFIAGSAPLISVRLLPAQKPVAKSCVLRSPSRRCRFHSLVIAGNVSGGCWVPATYSSAVCRVKLRSSTRVREGLVPVWRDALAVASSGPGGHPLALRGCLLPCEREAR